MDAKITKLRLSRMLSYDWLKIIGLAVAIIFVWVLVFTTTATRVLNSQQFVVCNYMGNTTLKDELTQSLNQALKDGTFTHEVIEVNTVDLTVDRSAAYQLLQARSSTKELDFVFINQEGNPDTAQTITDENGNKQTVYKRTYLEDFLSGYRSGLFLLDPYSESEGLFFEMKNFLNRFYTGKDYTTGEVDTALVEANFRDRLRVKTDKRYKTEAQIKAGVQGEIERMEKYKKALNAFYGYLEEGLVKPVTSKYTPSEEEKSSGSAAWEGVYSINICPDTNTMGKLSNLVSYETTVKNEDGAEKTEYTAKDMNVCIFDSNGDERYRFEALVYLTEVIESVRS